jgi:hypothetical protein
LADSGRKSQKRILSHPLLFPGKLLHFVPVALACVAGVAALAGAGFGAGGGTRGAPQEAAGELPPAPGAHVVTLTPQPGWYTEPSIAVNPADPRQVVAAFQDNAHVSYSNDGGRVWLPASGTAPPNFLVSGDVSVTYDSRGHAILCYIAFDKLGTTDYWAHNATRNGIFIRRSLDGGMTWETKDVAVMAHETAPGIPFEDKPYVVADNTHSRYAGNLYVGWTHFTLEDSTILFSRSTDGGKTWSTPMTISTTPGLPRDDTGALEGFDAAIGPDGTIYAAWSNGIHLEMATSSDGGRNFSKAREIVATAAAYFKPQNVVRGDGFPQIAIDPRGGKRGGPLYVFWTDYRNGDIDVFTARSSDHGRTWGAPVRVNSDPKHNGADQFMQWAAADPLTGDLYVVFYDRRGDPKNTKTTITLARSADGGRTFLNYSWMGKPFDPDNAFIGDYSGLAVYNGCVYGDWTVQLPAPAQEVAGYRGRREARSIVQVGVARFPATGGRAQACE